MQGDAISNKAKLTICSFAFKPNQFRGNLSSLKE